MGGEFCYCDQTLFVTPTFASLLDLYLLIVQYLNMDRFLKRSAPPDDPVVTVSPPVSLCVNPVPSIFQVTFLHVGVTVED